MKPDHMVSVRPTQRVVFLLAAEIKPPTNCSKENVCNDKVKLGHEWNKWNWFWKPCKPWKYTIHDHSAYLYKVKINLSMTLVANWINRLYLLSFFHGCRLQAYVQDDGNEPISADHQDAGPSPPPICSWIIVGVVSMKNHVYPSIQQAMIKPGTLCCKAVNTIATSYTISQAILDVHHSYNNRIIKVYRWCYYWIGWMYIQYDIALMQPDIRINHSMNVAIWKEVFIHGQSPHSY